MLFTPLKKNTISQEIASASIDDMRVNGGIIALAHRGILFC